ncbi:WD40/YVTN/BNR-like repeat-containing protein [Roseateles sp. P5_E7]
MSHQRSRLMPLWLLVIALVSLLGLRTTRAQAATWSPMGPDSATVLTAAHQPGNGAVMLAGTYFGGLYRSSNWGYTWAPIDGGFTASAVFALQFDARQPGRVYAGMFRDGVWRSDDAGLTWAHRSVGLADGNVQALAIDPTTSSRVLAATASGLYLSDDAAGSWTAVPSLAGVITRAIAHDPKSPSTVYLGSVGRGVFKSLDRGNTWAAFSGGRTFNTVNALNFDAQGHLYAATDSGVFQLPAGGTVWVNLTFDLPKDVTVVHLLPHPTAPNVLFVATAVGTYVISNWATTPKWFLWNIEGSRFIASDEKGLIVHVAAQIGAMRATTDFGTTWVRADRGIQTAFVASIATGRSGSSWRMLAGTEAGVTSLDIGQPWKTALKLNQGVFDLQFTGSNVYAGTEASGISRSLDAGVTWADASTGIVPSRVSGLSYTSATSTPTLLAASGAGAYRSTDDGATWSPIRLTEVSYVLSVAADPVRAPIVWLGASNGRVYRSIDSGQHFGYSGSGLPDEDIVQLVHAPWAAVYAVTASGKLYSTMDDGVSWFPTASTCGAPAVALQVDATRPWVLYLATRGGGICKSESRGLSWAPANTGITQPTLSALWIDPRNPQQLWAGGQGRVFRSTNGGQAWTAQTTGLPAGPVTAITSDPVDSSRVHALVYGAGLYESRDSGSSWMLKSSAVPAANALTLVTHPTQPGRLFTGTLNSGVQGSGDYGATWAGSSRGMSLFVRSIAADPGNASTLYAGTLDGSVFRSGDGATSWAPVAQIARNVFRVRSPSAQRVLVGTSSGVVESLDGGTSWATLGQGAMYVMSMANDPADAHRVMVGSVAGQAWLGETSGLSSRSVGAGLPALELQAMAACPDGSVWTAPERAGVWRSSFATPGAWTNPGSAGLGNAQVLSLGCDPRSGLLYAATNGNGVWLSLDKGANWIAINQGLVGNVVRAVLPSPTKAWQVWAAVGDGTVYRSDNAGQQWVVAGSGLPAGGVNLLAMGPDGVLFAATTQGVYRLPAGGNTWVAATGAGAGAISLLWADPLVSGKVFAASAGGGLYGSSDGGANWRLSATDGTSATMTAMGGSSGAGSRLYLGTAGTGLAWSSDGGATFGQVQSPESQPQVVLDIATDATDAQTLYLASGGQGVLLSRDGGGHWELANNGLHTTGSLEVLCLARHPTRSGEVYAGTRAGVFVSRDYGGSWTAMNQGLFNKNATALHFDTVLADTLYVGLEGGGIWFYDTRP